jgi:nucleoprotein TPR
MLQEELSM